MSVSSINSGDNIDSLRWRRRDELNIRTKEQATPEEAETVRSDGES
jgi:hypothetical protein